METSASFEARSAPSLYPTIALVGAAATWSFETRAQERGPLIGYLTTGALGSTPPSPAPALEAFRRGLREQGYVDGKNIRIEVRSAEGDISQLPTLAIELVQLKVQVIVACPSVASPYTALSAVNGKKSGQ
jgi:putative ABC transport system substrate-binding protein